MESFSFPEQYGKGTLKRLIIRPVLELVISDYCFWSDITTTFRGQEPLIELIFCMEGDGIIEAAGQSADIHQNDWQLWLAKDIKASMVHSANEHATFVGLRMTAAVFDHYLQASCPGGGSSFDYIVGSGHMRIF